MDVKDCGGITPCTVTRVLRDDSDGADVIQGIRLPFYVFSLVCVVNIASRAPASEPQQPRPCERLSVNQAYMWGIVVHESKHFTECLPRGGARSVNGSLLVLVLGDVVG